MTTCLNLNKQWEGFINSQVASGRYASASELVEEALSLMQAQEEKLQALRAHLLEGAKQAEAGEFIENFSMSSLINELDATAL